MIDWLHLSTPPTPEDCREVWLKLVSEIKVGLEYNSIDGHTGCLKSWLQLLKNDAKAIFRASSEAMKAKRFLIPEEEEIVL